MEEKGIGSIIYYIVIAVVTIASIVISSKRKKQQAKSQQTVPANPFPDISDKVEDFFPRQTMEEIIEEPIADIQDKEKPSEKKVIQDYSNYDKTRFERIRITNKALLLEPEENSGQVPFDVVKAVIYSEIINKKY